MRRNFLSHLRKLVIILIVNLTTIIQCYTQELPEPDHKFQVGLNISPVGYYKVTLRFYTEGHTDYPPEFSVKSRFSTGVSIYYRLNDFISIGSGVSYSSYKIARHYYTDTPTSQNVILLEIPLSLQFEFLKYIYTNQGFILNFELDKPDARIVYRQTGIGYFISVGIKYNFKSNISVFAGPVVKAFTIIPFNSDNDSAGNGLDVLNGIGFNFGIMTRL